MSGVNHNGMQFRMRSVVRSFRVTLIILGLVSGGVFPPGSWDLPAQGFWEQVAADNQTGVDLRVTVVPGEAALEHDVLVLGHVAYHTLHFTATDTSFAARVRLIIRIQSDTDDTVMAEDTVSQRVQVALYRETGSRMRYARLTGRYPVPPGRFTIIVRRWDTEINFRPVERKITVPDVTGDPLAMTEFLFHTQEGGQERLSFPGSGPTDVTPDFGSLLTIQSMLWSQVPVDTLTVQWSVYSLFHDGERIADSTSRIATTGNWTAVSFDIADMPAPTGPFVVSLEVNDGQGQPISRQTTISLRWRRRPLTDRPLEERIQSLYLFADPSDLHGLAEASATEQQQVYTAIWTQENVRWNRRYPDDPGRVEIEFYNRVDYANQQYWTPQMSGWQTDRGRIFIQYGMPDQLERRAHHQNQPPEEIWIYRQPERRFVFVDQRRDGVFRLREIRGR